jgi:hypothetical protein
MATEAEASAAWVAASADLNADAADLDAIAAELGSDSRSILGPGRVDPRPFVLTPRLPVQSDATDPSGQHGPGDG